MLHVIFSVVVPNVIYWIILLKMVKSITNLNVTHKYIDKKKKKKKSQPITPSICELFRQAHVSRFVGLRVQFISILTITKLFPLYWFWPIIMELARETPSCYDTLCQSTIFKTLIDKHKKLLNYCNIHFDFDFVDYTKIKLDLFKYGFH